MDETAQVHLAALEDEVRAAALSEAGRHSALWCLGRLLPQYALHRQTCESRYGEEITRLVRAVLKLLTDPSGAFPVSEALAESLLVRLHLIHEQFGIPRLDIGLPRVAKPLPQKGRLTG